MSNNTTIFYSDDPNELLEDVLLKLLKGGDKTYNLEDPEGIESGMSPNNGVFIDVKTNNVYSKSKRGTYVSRDEYWDGTNTVAKKHRHWQRREITVRILMDVFAPVHKRGASIEDTVQMVEIRYWWSKQNSSFIDNMMGHMLYDPSHMAGQVELEWDNRALDVDGEVNHNAYLNALGSILAASKIAEKKTNDTMNKLKSMLKVA